MKLVKAWERSGESSASFARSVGVKPGTLVWWRWRLASRRSKSTVRRRGAAKRSRSTAKRRSSPRLVAIEVDETRDNERGHDFAWELESAGGDVLRVRATITASDLDRVIAAFTARDERRP